MAEEEKKSIEAWGKELKRLADAEEWERLGQRAEICIGQYPEHAIGYFYRAVTNIQLGQYEEAIADYDKAIELDHKYIDAYYNRGNAKANLERHEEAIADYDKATTLIETEIKSNPNDQILLERLNLLLERISRSRVVQMIAALHIQKDKELETYKRKLTEYQPAALTESYDKDIKELKEQLFGTSSSAEASQKQLALPHRIWHLAKHPLLMVLIIIPLLVFIFAASSHHLIHSELFTLDICERSTIPYCQIIALTFNPWIWGLTIIVIMMMKSSNMNQIGLVKASRKIARQLRFYILIIWLLVTDLYFNIFGLSTSGIIAPTGSFFITSARYALSLFFVLTPFLLYYRHVSRRERELYVLWLSMTREKHRQLFWMVQAKTDPDDMQGKLALTVLNHMNENSAADMALQMLKPRKHTPQSLGWFRPRENHIHSIRYKQNNP